MLHLIAIIAAALNMFTSGAPTLTLAPAPPPAPAPTSAATPAPVPEPKAVAAGAATVSVPAVGISNVRVVRYTGSPDDARGTAIQNRGLIAAPHGKWGGVGPGEVGNFMLSGHRTSDGAPMADVPALKIGDLVNVRQGSRTFVYKIEHRMFVDFRNKASRNSQRLPVPGSPGLQPTRPAIVLSTCATQEDDAAGLTWRDKNGNPAHRIAVAGFLVDQ